MNKTLLGWLKDSCGYLPSLTLCRSLTYVHLCFHIIVDPEHYEKSVIRQNVLQYFVHRLGTPNHCQQTSLHLHATSHSSFKDCCYILRSNCIDWCVCLCCREARVRGVQLRWWQPRHEGAGHDQWALDHVEVILWVQINKSLIMTMNHPSLRHQYNLSAQRDNII